jgi:hopanoid biosynthesis associated RND transporter like protein HpnN
MERNSQNQPEEGLFRQLVQSLTASVAQRPFAALGFVAIISLLSLGVSARFLTFKTNRADLIDPNTPFHQRWIQFVERFGEDSDIVCVVEAENTNQLRTVLERLGSSLEAERDLFDRVMYKVDPRSLQSKGLQYLAPGDLEKANARLEMYAPILEGHWNRAGLESYCRRLADYIRTSAEQGEAAKLEGAISQSQALISSLGRFLQSPGDFTSPWPEVISASSFPQGGTLEARYQITPSGRMGFVLARPRDVSTDFTGSSASLTRLRKIVSTVKSEFSNVKIGVTGIPVLEADEMQRSQADMSLASLISFVGVGLVMVMGFRGLRYPVLSMAVLAVGMAWSLGFATLAVGHLNILSVSFAAILIGLGADYAVHYLTHYLDHRKNGEDVVTALVSTSKHVGTGITAAAVTSALAFFSAVLTSFLGVAELGVIAGGGILLCAGLTFIVLPALIVLADKRFASRRVPAPYQGDLIRHLTTRFPRLVSCVTLILVLGIGIQALTFRDGKIESRVKYDYNLLNLQAEGVESVDLQKRIFQETNGSLLYAVSICDSAQAARLRKEKFLELPSVSRVEDLASYLPSYPASETNLLVQAIHARLSGLGDLPREVPQMNPLSIGHALEALYQSLHDRPEPAAQGAAAALNGILDSFEQIPLEYQVQLLTGYQQGMLMALHRQFQAVAAISDPVPISANDFPDALRSRYVSDQGEWLLRIYPSHQIWDEDPLRTFVTDVRSIDPEVTGTPLQNYEAAGQIQHSYMQAAIYSLGAIILVLLIDTLGTGPLIVALLSPLAAVAISLVMVHQSQGSVDPIWLVAVYVGVAVGVGAVFDFRSIRQAFLALLPSVGGIFMTFGIMSMTHLDLNPANMIVLPLVLGLGVDCGVLVMHDYRSQRHRYMTSGSVINAIVMNAVTTIVGFASMLISAHRGLVSLGLVLVIGLSCSLFISVGLLPALLTWISQSRRGSDPDFGEEIGPDEEIPAVVPLRYHQISDVA